MAKLKVVHKWVGLGRVQSFMLILGRIGLGHFTCESGWVGSGWVTSLVNLVGSGQENWTNVQLCNKHRNIVTNIMAI